MFPLKTQEKHAVSVKNKTIFICIEYCLPSCDKNSIMCKLCSFPALPTRLAIGPTDYPANSEILITEIGPGGDVTPALACFTPNPSRTDWYFPDGAVVPMGASTGDIVSDVQPTAITLKRRNDATSPTGLYCCGSPTLTVEQRLCITLCE